MIRTVKFALAAVGLAAAIGVLSSYGDLGGASGDVPRYRVAAASRGPIAATVSASGTVKAVVTVDVGTQVSGMVKTLLADFNSKVEAGQVVARIDSAPFEARSEEHTSELQSRVDI